MNEKTSEQEFETVFHMTFVAVISILGLLLIAVVLSSKWDYGYEVSMLIGIGIVICWGVHLFQLGKPSTRTWFYTILGLAGILYYGAQTVAVTDVPIVICLFIIILSANQDIRLIYLLTLAYPAVLMWNIFVTGYIGENLSQIMIARIILGVVCLGCAVVISRFFIQEQKRSRQIQKKTEEELIQAKKENECFLVNVSHELRTPINAVNGMSEIILHRELDKELKNEVQSIQDAGKRLYGQVSDILDYSELITGTLSMSAENYEILSAVNDAVSDVQWKRMNGNLDVAIDIQADVPRLLHGDVGKLKKIIVALMDNAIKFTETGGAYLYISKRDEDYGINLNIDLWDTGIGMGDDQLKKLFANFYKGDSGIERKTGGLGLGLAIVHGLVSAMSGFISIESKEGKGTHVHISIPQQVVDEQSSIYVENRREFRIACYFNKEKYVRSEVADYYYTMIDHIKKNIGLNIIPTDSLAQLKETVEKKNLTHVFIAGWEYEMDRDYFEALAEKLHVILIAGDSLQLRENSKVNLLKKPVYILAVVNLLNETVPGAVREKTNKKLTFSGVRVLVVDDDRMNLTVAKGVLKTYGILADTCLSGPLAIEKCMIEDYDLIFMDHMMPGMNGIAAMKQIRELRNGHYKEVPMVVLTANAVSGAREMFLSEGFDEFISKPIELSTMSRVLRKLLVRGENADE